MNGEFSGGGGIRPLDYPALESSRRRIPPIQKRAMERPLYASVSIGCDQLTKKYCLYVVWIGAFIYFCRPFWRSEVSC